MAARHRHSMRSEPHRRRRHGRGRVRVRWIWRTEPRRGARLLRLCGGRRPLACDPAAPSGSRGAISVVAFDGRIHAIGGRDTRSIDWHDAYDPKSDSWTSVAAIPGPRDHAAAVPISGVISVVGGRMDTFDFNTGMH